MRSWIRAASLICLMPLLSCSTTHAPNLGVIEGRLVDCPSSPNCVSSDATDARRRVDAFALAAAPLEAWRVIRKEVTSLPRTAIVEESVNYLHAESASRLFGFVDDLELDLRESENIVAVRSASRVGYSDLGVNRRRVEQLREALRARGIVQ